MRSKVVFSFEDFILLIDEKFEKANIIICVSVDEEYYGCITALREPVVVAQTVVYNVMPPTIIKYVERGFGAGGYDLAEKRANELIEELKRRCYFVIKGKAEFTMN